jgi:hypothetical protein
VLCSGVAGSFDSRSVAALPSRFAQDDKLRKVSASLRREMKNGVAREGHE